jgi:biopolymer transport protein ExbB
MNGGSLLTWVESGGIAMYPLLFCSILSAAVIVERLWAIARAQRASTRVQALVVNAIEHGRLTDAAAISRLDPSPFGALYESLIGQPDPEVRERIAERRHRERTRDLKRHVWILGTIGSLAPFIGLFGTVVGIIRAFDNMAATGSGGFAVVAAGISEALIATACGLVVGVLSIAAYNTLIARTGELAARWRDGLEDVLIRLSEQPGPATGGVTHVRQSR